MVRYQLQAKATLRVIEPVVSLGLEPAEATILEGDNQPYTAEGTTAAGRKVEVTGQTEFTISEPGKCSTDPRGRVSCTAEPGTYTVKGTLRQEGKDDLTDEAVLHVDPVVASLKLKPESVEIALGGSQPYTVEGFAADGRPVDLGEVTAKPVLSITQERQPSGDCKETTCIPAKLGEHTVTATLTQKGHPDLTAEAVLRVIDPVVSLELKPAEATILEGDNQPYTAEGTTAAGRKVEVTGQTQFTISEPGKCSTDPRGRVSCTAEPGTYTVKGTLRQEGKDDLTDEAVLHVDPVVASLKLKPESVEIALGGSQPYTVEGFAADGRPVDLGEVTAKPVLSITQERQPSGDCKETTCIPAKLGEHTVTATLTQKGHPDLTAEAVLRVIDPVVSLELKPAEATILEGDNQPYTAEGTTAAGRKVEVTGQTQFTISEPGKCSTDPRGRVSCTAEPGTYTVKGTLRQEGKDDLTDEAVLHVDPVVASLKLKPESVEIALGGSQPYTVEGFAADGRPVDLGEVTAKPVLSITQERQPSGDCKETTCIPAKLGEHTVTATLTQKGHPDLTAEAVLRVIDPVVSLELKPAEATILEGDNQPYTAEGTTAAGRKVEVTGQTQFTISEPGKCSTDPRGRVSCTAEPGTYTVKGTLRQEGKDDLTDEAVLHVDPVVASLKLKPESVEIALGGSQPYTVEGFAADGRPVDLGEVTAKPVLSITQERQPSGDCKETTCIPAKLGEHTVTATLTQKGHPDLTAEAVLRVIDPVVSLELKPAEATILEGDNQPYTAEGTTAAGRKVEVTGQTQFTISEPGKCSTDPRGRVSCTAEPGTYTVKGTLRQEGKDDLTDEAVLHVDPVVASLKLKPESVEIALGGSQPYTVEGFAADGRPVDLGEVTAKPVLSITQERQPSGDCKGTTCTPPSSASRPSPATSQKGQDQLRATATLTVVDGPTTQRRRLLVARPPPVARLQPSLRRSR